jgi:hypothetical protein
MKNMKRDLLLIVSLIFASLGMAAETNVISFAYTTSIAADASTPDTWTRKLNDGYWTNGVSDAVKYVDDVVVTADLGRRMQLSQVALYTYSETGAETLSTGSATLECSPDSMTWMNLGAMASSGDGAFVGSNFWANARYLRVNSTKASDADGQLIAEIVVSSSAANSRALLPLSYTASPPAHPTIHSDTYFTGLKNGLWSSARDESVQYGVSSTSDIDPEDPALCIASNVLITVALVGFITFRSDPLYAYNLGGNTWGTERVVLSNSLDGVNWTCLGEQTLYASLVDNFNVNGESCRFDFILPNVQSRYLAFACNKKTGTTIIRQLLGEIQVQTSTFESQLGDSIYYTYEFNKDTSVSHDKEECPRLTDQAWTHVTGNAIRFYDDVEITADLGMPMYVVGTDLICWSNEFSAGGTYYGTGRIVVNGSLDKTNWTELAEITDHADTATPYEYAVTFTNLPYVRYLRFDTYRCDGSATGQDFTAQIMGELFIYPLLGTIIGEAPVEAANTISFADFESDPLLPSGIVRGGTTNGWTFSDTDTYHYSGFQRNNSAVSTNRPGNTDERYYAPQGVQTAVLMGNGTMETQISVPEDGDYKLQFLINAANFVTFERGGHDFRIMLDGVEVGVVQALQLIFVEKEVLLRNVTAGMHTLRFEGIRSINLNSGSLIDDLQLLRYELPADQVTTQGADFTLVADSAIPLTLSYEGSIQVGDLWVDGVHLPKGKYSADINTSVFDGPGYIGFNRGTIILIK